MNAPVNQSITQASKDVGERAQALWKKRPGLLRGRNLWIVAGLIAALAAWSMLKGGDNSYPYRTAAVDNGAITRAVSATGTLQPVVSANVGSTVSGPVKTVDVDFNSQVRIGQVLARLDPAPFQAQVTETEGALSQAQAQYATANADYQRYLTLNNAGFASAQLMEQQRAARQTAAAAVQSARANLFNAQTNLDRSIIRSPINGVVVDREVNVGQSVAASFQAATLFVIAQDLSHLQANITVDEADIGDVRQGQDATFTVDAFPDREFQGVVTQVRQQGTSDQGVVSYTVVVSADNPDHTLLPGMTANANIVIERQNQVLRVPNTALRFRPNDPDLQRQQQQMMAQDRGAGAGGLGGQAGQAGANNAGQSAGGGGAGGAGGAGRAQFMAARMAQRLQLTPAQQTTLMNALQSAQQAAPPAAEDASPSDRRGAMRRVMDAAIAALEPSLSAQQKQLLQQMRAGAQQRQEPRNSAVVWVLAAGQTKPHPVRIQTGIADDTFTRVYSGLNAGDQVVIGGGPPSKTQTQTRGPFGGPGGGGGRGFRGG
jgi:HlyD family secretion protein